MNPRMKKIQATFTALWRTVTQVFMSVLYASVLNVLSVPCITATFNLP